MIGDSLLDPQYAFVSAYLKGEEHKLVTSDHINRMSAASSMRDALRVISDTYIGSYLEETPVKTFNDLNGYLWEYFLECITHIESFKCLPDDMRKILSVYIVKYDVANIKATLLGILTGKKARVIPVGVIKSYGLLDRLASAENLDSIVELLIACRLGDYASILKEYKIDEGAKSRLLTEAKLDGEYYKSLLNMAKGVKDGSVLSKALGLILDLTNLQIISRAIIEGIGSEAAECLIADGYMISGKTGRELLQLKLDDIPRRLVNTQYQGVADEVSGCYNKSKRITAVDEIIDKHKFRLTRELLSPWVLSPLVIVWYLITKEAEIRNLRLVLKALSDNIPLGEIKNYLVPIS